MSWVRIYIHIVFTTKNRIPFLNCPEIRKYVFQHIKQNANEKGIWLDSVSGYTDHAHCLVSLGPEQSISNVVQLIKGESSHWINKERITKEKFKWQNDYWAVGVNERGIENVRNYIHNQENHHKKRLFKDELQIFIQENNLEK